MTPKEKAKELIDKYQLMVEIKHIDMPSEITNPLMAKNARVEIASKKCALIAVDEILKYKPREPMNYTDTIGYWKEVKQEIEAL